MTNPVINSFLIVDNLHSAALISGAGLHYVLGAVLFAALVAVRIFYAPWALCLRLILFFVADARSQAIPLVLRLVWMALPVLIVYGSVLYLQGLLADLRSGATTTLAKAAKKQ
mmetsp:Transcript_82883/g.222316  ORF Transcript_82883/g.222316 Transcript_82883/m.222316 type:complete len:113 (+) Transcript_82883:1-339(+)